MSLRIVQTQDASDDTMAIADYLAEVSSFDASDEFLAAVQSAYRMLSDMPGLGASREYANSRLINLRMWPIPRFRQYLIFYQATKTELTILHVLNGAQDLQRIFQQPSEK